MQVEKIISSVFGPAVSYPVSGGIINRNFLVIADKPLVGRPTSGPELISFLTLYGDSNSWWKIPKEFAIKKMLTDSTIKRADIRAGGFHTDSETNDITGYLVKEFVFGRELDSVLRQAEPLPDQQWEVLLSELAQNLALIHKVPLEGFGIIHGSGISGSTSKQVPDQSSWSDFLKLSLREMGSNFRHLPPHYQIGEVTQSRLFSMWETVAQWFMDHEHIFNDHTHPRLTHNDARFANFLVGNMTNEPFWHLQAIIDFEWALAGDPELDLIQVENWLQFAPYKNKFWQHRQAFVDSYLDHHALSPHYHLKRQFYHWWRSLSYLAAIFNSPTDMLLPPQTPKYVQQHYHLMKDVGDQKVASLFESRT